MPLPQQQAAIRLSGDAALLRKQYVTGLKLQQRKKLREATAATKLGPRPQERLIKLATQGKLSFPALLDALSGAQAVGAKGPSKKQRPGILG